MDYIFCSVIWAEEPPDGYTAARIAASRLDCGGNIIESKSFLADECSENGGTVKAFAEWCGSDYMLCLWDGFSAGRIKKALAAAGYRHPYIHLYHLVRVFELSMEKCSDVRRKRSMAAGLERKPFYSGKKNAAEQEVRWMCGIFSYLDFSVMEKKPAIDFIDQPSNKYFVFKNGKCFHTKECRIVKDAAVSSLRSYTYYAKVTDAGFTPCSRCKPVDNDAETAAEMRALNKLRRSEAVANHTEGFVPVKKKRKKPMNVYKSLAHMCGMYGVGFEKKGTEVFIEHKGERFRFAPEAEKIVLYREKNGEYKKMPNKFADPYEAVRYIIHLQDK